MNPRDIDWHKLVVPAIAGTLVFGAVWLAVIDKDTRPAFSRLVDLAVGGMLGAAVPTGSRREP